MEDKLSLLMEQQNKLLDQQNILLQQLIELENDNPFEECLLDGEKILVRDLFRDEIRNGFLVTVNQKRIWNIQLNIVAEVDRICKKHGINYFACRGTLLGAVRHKGFVPWNDDLDIAMLRPDYENFKRVVKQEIKDCYFVDAWHDYKFEDEEKVLPDKSFLQFVTKQQRKTYPDRWPFWVMMKIKDNRTTFIQYRDRPHVHQGIWVDIFPLDPVPPFSNAHQQKTFEIESLLFKTAISPAAAKKALQENKVLALDKNSVEQYIKLPHTKKALALDLFAYKNFAKSDFVGHIRGHILGEKPLAFKWENFEEVVYMPFEEINLPVPRGYEDCLTTQYGDWHKPIIFESHAIAASADISYKDYFKEIKQ